MNPILITRIADEKTWTTNREDLMNLVREIDISFPSDPIRSIYLVYDGEEDEFFVAYNAFVGERVGLVLGRQPLDPAKYKISFANTLDIERVREMIEEIKSLGRESRFDSFIDSIASKYL